MDPGQTGTVGSVMVRWLRGAFLSGLLAVLPISLTLYILWLLYRWIDSIFGYATPIGTLIRRSLGFWIPGLGVYVTLSIVLVLGVLTRHYVGRRLYEYFERKVIYAIPIVRKMYSTIKQITNAVFARDTSAFQRVVLVEYPRRGIYTVGFVTNPSMGRLQRYLPEKCVSVFVFTVPSPMSGYYLIVPERDLINLDIPVEEGIRLTISMGLAVSEPALPPPQKEQEKGQEKEQEHVVVR